MTDFSFGTYSKEQRTFAIEPGLPLDRERNTEVEITQTTFTVLCRFFCLFSGVDFGHSVYFTECIIAIQTHTAVSPSQSDGNSPVIGRCKGVRTGKQIAVVGSGPAGITVAIKMAQLGCAVTVFEQRPEIGGVLEYGIPEFRLPRALVQKYRHVMCSLGVRVRPSTTIGGALHIDDLLRDGYDAVFVGTGTWRARKLGIPGESRGNVLFGIDYLVDPSSVAIGQNVAVIGAGNVAMDVARTALRSGARKVTVYARSRHISAIDDEVELTELDGAEIVRGKAICAIDDNGPVFETAIFDEDNNVVGYEEELDHVSADTVVIAASQVPKDKLVLTTGGLETDHRGLLSVDEHGMTTVPGVFAAGDVVNGPLTVVHAVAGAKLAVEGMTTYLGL